MATEDEYKKELADNGVELPDEADLKTEEKSEELETADAPDTKSEEKKEPLQTETKIERTKPRSIYDEYKDKKSELKTEKELRDQDQVRIAELETKLAAATANKGEDTDAGLDAVKYAEKIGADPELVARIIADSRKGAEKPALDEETKKDLAEFKTWKAQNSQLLEKQMFDAEFDKITPSLKEQFPSASDDELKAIKKELDTISHSKDWHDKDLDYIAYKHKDQLSALVSPRKRGMESKTRKDNVEAADADFDPTPDFSAMTPKQMEAWEEQYKGLSKNDGLMKDAKGKRSMV